MVSPENFRKNIIGFDVEIAGHGTMVFTRLAQYHAVVNVTTFVAMAINFSPLNQPILPESLLVCKECRLYSIQCRAIHRVYMHLLRY